MDFNKIRILSTMCLFIMYADIVLIMYLYDEYFKLWICFCYCSSLIISEKSYWNQHILYIFHGEISMLCKPNHTRFSLMSRYKTQHLKHIYTWTIKVELHFYYIVNMIWSYAISTDTTYTLIHIEKPKFLYE